MSFGWAGGADVSDRRSDRPASKGMASDVEGQTLWPLVLKLSGPDRWEREIVEGCKAFGLEASKTAHRHILLGIRPKDHFAVPTANALTSPLGDLPKKSRGRPVKSESARAMKLRRQVVKLFPDVFGDLSKPPPPDLLKAFPTADAIYKRLGKKWFQENYGNQKRTSIIEYIRRDVRS